MQKTYKAKFSLCSWLRFQSWYCQSMLIIQWTDRTSHDLTLGHGTCHGTYHVATDYWHSAKTRQSFPFFPAATRAACSVPWTAPAKLRLQSYHIYIHWFDMIWWRCDCLCWAPNGKRLASQRLFCLVTSNLRRSRSISWTKKELKWCELLHKSNNWKHSEMQKRLSLEEIGSLIYS